MLRVFAVLAASFLLLSFSARGESSLPPIVIREERVPGAPATTASEYTGTAIAVDARGESSLVRTLARRAGVFVQRSGADDSHSSIQLRGQDPNQTRFFLEGIPLTDAQYHASQLGWFPAEAVESLDLFPEGSPAVLGADGLGGAIALHLAPPSRQHNLIGARVGAFGARRLFARLVAREPLAFSVFVDGAEAREDFLYRDNAGTPFIPEDDRWARREGNGQRWITALPQVTLWENAHTKAQAMSFHTLRGNEIPGAVGMALNGKLDTQYHLGGLRVQGTHALLDWEAMAFGWGLDQRFSSAEDLSALQIQSSLCTSWGFRALIKKETARLGWEASLGSNADDARLSTSQASLWASRRVIPLGASARWSLNDQWTLKPALLAQYFSYKGAGERQTLAVSPRLGLEWAPWKSQRLRLSAGRYHRAPALAEMYGSPAAIAPNPALADERAWKGEVGWDGRWPVREWILREVQLSATLSAAIAENLIVLVPNSQLNFVAQNIGSSRIFTPEVGMEWGLGRDWSFRANAALLSTQNLSTAPAYQGRALPMRPAFRGGLEVEWAQGPWRATYSLQATGPLYADAANTRRVGEYWEHGAWGSWNSRRWGTWMLELRNLTDATTVGGREWNFILAQNTTGLAGFPAPGRRVYFTWRYDI